MIMEQMEFMDDAGSSFEDSVMKSLGDISNAMSSLSDGLHSMHISSFFDQSLSLDEERNRFLKSVDISLDEVNKGVDTISVSLDDMGSELSKQTSLLSSIKDGISSLIGRDYKQEETTSLSPTDIELNRVNVTFSGSNNVLFSGDNKIVITGKTTLQGEILSSGGGMMEPAGLPEINIDAGEDEGGSKGNKLLTAAQIGAFADGIRRTFFSQMSQMDENFTHIADKISKTMGQGARRESRDTYREVLRSARDTNHAKGHLGDLSQLISVEDYNEAINRALDFGVAQTGQLTTLTEEISLMNNLLPGLSVDEGFFKSVTTSYEDAGARIRGTTMLIKSYSDNMFTTPETLNNTVTKYHKAISAMTSDLTSYTKTMDNYIRTTARMDQAGLDLGIDDTIDYFRKEAVSDWDPQKIQALNLLGIGDLEEFEKLSINDREAATEMLAQGFQDRFGDLRNEDGTWNIESDADLQRYHTAKEYAKMLGQDIDDIMDATKEGGAIDQFNDSDGAEKFTGGIQDATNDEEMYDAIQNQAIETLQDQNNLTLEEEVKNIFNMFTQTNPILTDILDTLREYGIGGSTLDFGFDIVSELFKNRSSFKGLGGKISSGFKNLGGKMKGLPSAVKNLGGKIGSGFKNLGGKFTSSKAGSSIVNAVKGLGSKIGSSRVGTAAKGGFGKVSGAVSKSMESGLLSKAGNLAKSGVSAVKSGGSKAISGLTSKIGSLSSKIPSLASSASSSTGAVAKMAGPLSKATGTLGKAAGALGKFAGPIGGGVTALVDAVGGIGKSEEWLGEEAGSEMAGKVSSAIGGALGGTGPGLFDEGSFGEKVGNVAGGAMKGAMIGSVVPGIGTAIGAAVGAVGSAIGGKNIAQFADGALEAFKEKDPHEMSTTEKAVDVAQTIPGLGSAVGLFKGIEEWDSDKGLAANLGNVAGNMAKSVPLVSGVMKGIEEWDSEKGIFSNIGNLVKDTAKSLPVIGTVTTAVEDFAGDTIDDITNPSEKKWYNPFSWFKSDDELESNKFAQEIRDNKEDFVGANGELTEEGKDKFSDKFSKYINSKGEFNTNTEEGQKAYEELQTAAEQLGVNPEDIIAGMQTDDESLLEDELNPVEEGFETQVLEKMDALITLLGGNPEGEESVDNSMDDILAMLGINGEEFDVATMSPEEMMREGSLSVLSDEGSRWNDFSSFDNPLAEFNPMRKNYTREDELSGLDTSADFGTISVLSNKNIGNNKDAVEEYAEMFGMDSSSFREVFSKGLKDKFGDIYNADGNVEIKSAEDLKKYHATKEYSKMLGFDTKNFEEDTGSTSFKDIISSRFSEEFSPKTLLGFNPFLQGIGIMKDSAGGLFGEGGPLNIGTLGDSVRDNFEGKLNIKSALNGELFGAGVDTVKDAASGVLKFFGFGDDEEDSSSDVASQPGISALAQSPSLSAFGMTIPEGENLQEGGIQENPVVAAIRSLEYSVVSRLDRMCSPQGAEDSTNTYTAPYLRESEENDGITSLDIRNYVM